MSERRLVVAVTGASGVVYAKRLLEVALEHYDRIYLTASENAVSIIQDEIGVDSVQELLPSIKIGVYSPTDVSAPPASGSHTYEAMVIVPCSAGTLGRIASGVSNDLVTRAADVCLKERRKLILVVRESPYNLIHLQNMTTLTQAGAIILPATPAFYYKPEKIDDLVNFVVTRILQQLGIEEKLVQGWKE